MSDVFYIFSGSKFGYNISIYQYVPIGYSIIIIYIPYPILYIYKLQLHTIIDIQYSLMPNFYLDLSFYTVKL